MTHHVARVLFVGGLLAIAYVLFLFVDTRFYQARQQTRLAEPVPPGLAATIPIDGEPIGRIVIPRLGMAMVFVQGDSASILRHAVGHVADTALPGASGNVVLAGHRDTFFRPLRDVRLGDAITITTRQGDYDYVVESTFVVSPTDVRVLEPTGGHTLTLITCFPFSYIGPAPDRFIVRAREQMSPARLAARPAAGGAKSRSGSRCCPPSEKSPATFTLLNDSPYSGATIAWRIS
jgi:sortase A